MDVLTVLNERPVGLVWCIFKAHVDSVQFQVMGDAMTLFAATHAADDGLGVGFGVALLAGRDGFVAGGMAFGAENITMLGPTIGEQRVDIVVASPAILRRGVGGEVDFEGHMGFVAILTGLRRHAFNVGFVAIETRGQIAMFGVTGGTVKARMD